MSKYEFTDVPGFPPGRTLEVGWDAPFATFFARTYDPPTGPDEDDREVFWVGGTPCELPTLESLAAALRGHGVQLTFPIEMVLASDKATEGERFAGRPATTVIAESVLTVVTAEQAARIEAALRRDAR